MQRWSLWFLYLLVFPVRGVAHEGPPFPILNDQIIGTYRVSVWTDPDIGVGIVYVVVEPHGSNELAPPTVVRVGIAPSSGRTAERVYETSADVTAKLATYSSQVGFDRGELFRIRVDVRSPTGSGELLAEVEATPDGTIGPIGLLIYSFPFIAIGGLWLKAIHRRRTARPLTIHEETRADGKHHG